MAWPSPSLHLAQQILACRVHSVLGVELTGLGLAINVLYCSLNRVFGSHRPFLLLCTVHDQLWLPPTALGFWTGHRLGPPGLWCVPSASEGGHDNDDSVPWAALCSGLQCPQGLGEPTGQGTC